MLTRSDRAGRGSHEEEAAGLPPPPEHAKLPGGAEPEQTSSERAEKERISGNALPGGFLENASSAIGVRIKMEWCPASFREDLFREDLSRLLGLGPQFIECVPRAEASALDLNLASDPSDPGERSSHRLAAELFSLCEDRTSVLAQRYNQGHEMFCHYPWATRTTRAQQGHSRAGDLSGKSPLEQASVGTRP